MLARSILLCLTLASYALWLTAQPHQIVLIGTEQGLSQGMVYSLLQSRDGFIWIATKDGLNRYDGYRFDVFTPDAFDPFSIASGEIQTIFEDSRGWLWLCYIGGVDIFEPNSRRFFHMPLAAIKDFRGYRISFWEDSDGTMWLAARRGILKIRAPEHSIYRAMETKQPFPAFEYTVIPVPNGEDGHILEANAIFRTKEGSLLVSTTGGVYELDPLAERFSIRPVALPGLNVTFFGRDKEERLWFKSRSIVCCIRKIQEKPDFIQKTVFNNDWLLDREGNVWSREEMTLRKWRAADLALGKPAQLEKRIVENMDYPETFYLTSLLIDLSGNVWAGTSGYGIVKYTMRKSNFIHCQPKISHRNIYEDPSGRLFTLIDLRTVYTDKYFRHGNTNPYFSKVPPKTFVKYLVFDRRGNCWINTDDRKICFVDGQKKNYQCIKANGRGIWATRRDRIVTLSEYGIQSVSLREGIFHSHPFARPLSFGYNISERYNLFYEGRDGTLWISAYEGLLKATPYKEGYFYEHYLNNPADRSSLSNNVVFSVAEDPIQPALYLWIGTKGGGLNRLDLRTGKFRHFTVAQGLPDNVIYGILPDESGSLWLSTNKGLCRFNCRDFTVKNFTVADGLQSNEFNQGSFIKTRDGTMIFGGVNGLTVFHPDSLQFNQYAPPTHIVEIMVNNKSISIAQLADVKRGRVLSLPYYENLVTIGFSALDYTNPQKNKYRYQLFREGNLISSRTESWVDIGTKNSLQFNALRPGNYVFRVLGSNNDGIWSAEPAILSFAIAPPWWASWWAYIIYAMVMLSAIAILHRYQLRQRLAQQEALRLRELDEFKSRLFTNITHEFRTPLTVILGVAEQIETQIGKGIKPHTDLIRRNGQTLLRLINQILDLSKIEAGFLTLNYIQADVLPYLRYITESLRTLANVQGVALRIDVPSSSIIMDYDPERLLHVVYNLLSNAIKFTPPGGEVAFRAKTLNYRDQAYLQLQISDTGIGIPLEDLPYIFDRFYQSKNAAKVKVSGAGIGLALTHELVKAMQGFIKVESSTGKGTKFTVLLPITTNAEGLQMGDYLTPTSFSPSPSFTPPLSPSSPAHRLLIIEDNPSVVDYLKICLWGQYHVDIAYNGQSGIDKAIESVPDLILSDVMMPAKDGFEVCDVLKNDERTSHIPIVLLSAKADVDSRIAGLKKGADAYVFKPFHREELLAILSNLIEVRKKLQEKYRGFALAINDNTTDNDPENAFLQKARQVVLEHLEDSSFNVRIFCRVMALSQPQLHRKLTALTNQNATHFIRSIRLAKAKELLQKGDMNVSEVAFAVGFDDPKYFSRIFTREFGISPSHYR